MTRKEMLKIATPIKLTGSLQILFVLIAARFMPAAIRSDVHKQLIELSVKCLLRFLNSVRSSMTYLISTARFRVRPGIELVEY